MHDIEPYYNWRHLYIADEDKKSPFYGRIYSEFEFSQTIYNYFIHPQWDDFGSQNLYLKILFVDYEIGYCIIEFIGEWNDTIENDIMLLKREIVDQMLLTGIVKFILIGENILNFHGSDECYYEEWLEDVQEKGGWIVMIGIPEQSVHDFKKTGIHRFVELLELVDWRTFTPSNLFNKIDKMFLKRLGE